MKRGYRQMAGKKITINGETFYSQEYFSFDGLSYGMIFKDERAFYENPDEVCYIPEHAFDDAEEIVVNDETFYAVDGYTRENLEELIKNEVDEDGEPIDIEYFFNRLVWACPETYLEEMAY